MTNEQLGAYLADHFADDLKPLDTGRSDPMYQVAPERMVAVFTALRDDHALAFDYLCCISAVDTGERFEIVYSLASVRNKTRLDLKFPLPYENSGIASVQEVWPGARWYEREIWELYGIDVRNHDDLTRFLLPDDWDQGYPMRKDWDAPDFKRMPER